jgi:hypothetical protein
VKVSPRASRTHEEIGAAVNDALRNDPRIGQLIGTARQLAASAAIERADPPADFWLAIGAAGELIWQSRAGQLLPRPECDRLAYQFAVIDFPCADDGALLPAKGELIVTSIPGMEGRPLWVLRTPVAVDAMRAVLEPGQVWIRADLVKADDWTKVGALASDQVRRVLGQVRRAGRPKGWRSAARSKLVERVREDPEISDDEINKLGEETLGWDPSSGDYVLVADRARRIRRSAGF